jgi:inosine triphosphate pyrophosphatase
MPTHVNLITGNPNKLREVKAILEAAGIEVRSQNIDLEEVQGSIEEVTESKCRRAAEQVWMSSHLTPTLNLPPC